MQKTLSVFFLFIVSSTGFATTLKSIGEETTCPWTTNAKYVLYTGLAVTAGLTVYRSQLVKPFQADQIRNKPLGDSSMYGDVLGQLVPNILYAGGMGVAAYYGDELAGERSMGMIKATSYAAMTTTLLKYTIRSPRPYNDNIRNSFPSGHTTTAFAFSGYVAAEHGWAWGAPALLMSSFVGYSRINDNRHWLNDVVAGATIGWMYGWGMAKLDQKRRAEKAKQKINPNPATQPEEKKEIKEDLDFPPVIVPMASSNTLGIGIYKEF
jgi:hypothetical protein